MSKIKAVILCGGQGTRIRDVSEVLPKPMLEIGGRPILWHIMKIYSHYGINDFVLSLGYKGWVVKEFFLNYYAKVSDFTLELGRQDSVVYHNRNNECDWKITLVDTGENAQTGARVAKAKKYLRDCDMFSVTYGDGVADVDIEKLISSHKKSGLMGTITGTHPSGRFGEIELKGNLITEFNEKPNVSSGLINGGYMFFNREALDKYFSARDDLILEQDVIPKMVKDKQIGIYKHNGLWQCVDTSREYRILNDMWNAKKAFWKVW